MKPLIKLISCVTLGLGMLPLSAADYEEKILEDFNASKGKWSAAQGARGELSKDHNGSLKLTLTNQGSGFEGKDNFDFSGWDKLKIDVFNTGDLSVSMTLRATDANGKQYQCWYQRMYPGKNTLEYNLRGFSCAVPEKGVVVDLDIASLRVINVRMESKEATGPLFIDNIRLSKGDEPFIKPEKSSSAAPLTAVPGNLIVNANFELGFQNWGTWGKWDGGVYNFNSGSGSDAYEGKFSGAIECEKVGRGGINQLVKLPKDGKYTVRFAVKGSSPKANKIRVGLYANKKVSPELAKFDKTLNFDISTEWKTHEFEWDAVKGEVRLYLMHTSDKSVFFDAVSLIPQGQKIATGSQKRINENPSKVVIAGDRTTVNGKQFFPIGIYGVEDPNVDFVGTGMNFAIGNAVGSTSDEWLTKCHKAGVMTIANSTGLLRAHLGAQIGDVVPQVKSRAAFFGYYLCDEPDHNRWTVSPAELRQATHILQKADPDHPTINLVMGWHRSMVYQYADSATILSCDPYSVTDMDKPVRITLCMDDALANKQPIWTVLQLGWDKTTSDYPVEVLQSQAYASVACGADGLLWFALGWAKKNQKHWAALKKLTLELKEIHDDLCGEEPADVQPTFSDPRIIGITKKTKDGLLLITVNKTLDNVGAVTVSVPGLKKKSGKGLFGSKDVAIKNGSFSANYTSGDRHIYRIK